MPNENSDEKLQGPMVPGIARPPTWKVKSAAPRIKLINTACDINAGATPIVFVAEALLEELAKLWLVW